MITTKANAKENLGEFICLSTTKAEAKENLQIFICNRFRADGKVILTQMVVLTILVQYTFRQYLSDSLFCELPMSSEQTHIVGLGCWRRLEETKL